MADPGVRRQAAEASIGEDHWGVDPLGLTVLMVVVWGGEPATRLEQKRAERGRIFSDPAPLRSRVEGNTSD